LLKNPQNNLKFHLYSCDAKGEVPVKLREDEITAVGRSLFLSEVCARVVELQRACCIDIELLYRWSSLQGQGIEVDWIVRCTQNGQCRCAVPLQEDPVPSPIAGLAFTPPEKTLEECIDLFYSATTAKDLSIMITLEERVGPNPLGVQPTDGCHVVEGNRGSPPLVLISSEDSTETSWFLCRLAVVDIDCKRHKSLESYYIQDQLITECASRALWGEKYSES
jgi:hypothetical protein